METFLCDLKQILIQNITDQKLLKRALFSIENSRIPSIDNEAFLQAKLKFFEKDLLQIIEEGYGNEFIKDFRFLKNKQDLYNAYLEVFRIKVLLTLEEEKRDILESGLLYVIEDSFIGISKIYEDIKNRNIYEIFSEFEEIKLAEKIEDGDLMAKIPESIGTSILLSKYYARFAYQELQIFNKLMRYKPGEYAIVL